MDDTRSASRASETEVMAAGTITVRYWAAARSAVGTPSEEVAVGAPTTLAALREELTRRHPDAARVILACSVLVGDQPAGRADPGDVVVPPGSVVELLPPFAGG